MRTGRDVVRWIGEHEPTAPGSLPEPPPPITDFQRHRIVKAEDVAAGEFRKLEAAEAVELARAAAEAVGIRPPLVSVEEGDWRVQVRNDHAIELRGRRWPELDILHALVHLAVPPVFPAHGIEFANALVGLAERFAPRGAAALARALDEQKVYRSAPDRVARARRTAVYIVGKEVGVLTRLVLDGPPEALLVQLLEVGDRSLLVCDDEGMREVDIERMRYISYRFAGSGGSRV